MIGPLPLLFTDIFSSENISTIFLQPKRPSQTILSFVFYVPRLHTHFDRTNNDVSDQITTGLKYGKYHDRGKDHIDAHGVAQRGYSMQAQIAHNGCPTPKAGFTFCEALGPSKS